MFPRSLEPIMEADVGNGHGAAGASPSQPSAPQTSTPSTSAASPTPTTGSAPGASGGAGGGQPATPPSTTTPGFNAGSSPATAATAPQPQAGQFSGPTAPAAQQPLDPIAMIRQLPPHFQQLLQMGYQAAQQRQQQPAQPQGQQPQGPKNPFGVPNEDIFALRNYLTRDAMGNIVPTPDAPLDAAQRFKAYVDAKEKAEHGFFQNPQQFLAPLLEQMVQPLLQKTFESQFAQRQTQAEAHSIFQQVSDWAVAKDGNGSPVYDYNPLTGERTERLTPAGQLYHQFLNSGRQMGINGPGNLHRYASNMLQAALAQHQARQAQAPANGAAAAQQFVQNAAAGGQVPPQPSPSNVPPPQPSRTLREAMEANFRQHGINDTALENQMRLPQGTAA